MKAKQRALLLLKKGNESRMKSWKSLEHLKAFSGLAQEITEQVSKDAEWSPPIVHSSWRFFDLETEQRRMEEYEQEQEKKRQVTITEHVPSVRIFPYIIMFRSNEKACIFS